MAKYLVVAKAGFFKQENFPYVRCAVEVTNENGAAVTGLAKKNFKAYLVTKELYSLTIDTFTTPDSSIAPGLYYLVLDLEGIGGKAGYLFFITVSQQKIGGHALASALKIE